MDAAISQFFSALKPIFIICSIIVPIHITLCFFRSICGKMDLNFTDDKPAQTTHTNPVRTALSAPADEPQPKDPDEKDNILSAVGDLPLDVKLLLIFIGAALGFMFMKLIG